MRLPILLRTLSNCCLLLVAGLVMALAQGQTPAPPAPAPAALPPGATMYQAPDYHDVLAGKAPLRILLTSGKTMLAWKGDAKVRVVDVAGNTELYSGNPAELVGLVRAPEEQHLWLRQNNKNFREAPGLLRLESEQPITIWSPQPDAWIPYAGPLLIVPTPDGKFSVVREISLDDYLRSVLPAEMPATFHPQALCAQAVIARTYALVMLGRHTAEGADLCAGVHCQVFSVDGRQTEPANDALRATQGLVLLAGDKLAEPYYHASCGGITDDAGYVWGPEFARPYLVGGLDMVTARPNKPPTIEEILDGGEKFCKRSTSAHWVRQFTAQEINALVAKNLAKVTGDPTVKIAHVTKLTVEQRTPRGRVLSLRIEGDGASEVVNGDAVRWLFGSGVPGIDGLWSTLFELSTAHDASGAVTLYTFRGAGRGHGIGLCQWGADGRARAGQSYRDILRAYFPGTHLSDEHSKEQP